HTGTDPYTTTASENLLTQFRSQFLSNVATVYDDAMLFSGRNFDGSTVGVAFVEAACTPWRFGISQFLSQSDFYTSLIAAHELGHNLGANHTSNGIMAPSITGETYFNQASKDEIAFYTDPLACFGLAAQTANGAPTLDPVGPQMVSEGQTLTIPLAATDPDGDSLTYGATPLPQGASLTTGGVFSWTPLRSAAGCNATTQVNVQFTASDGALSANETVPISVVDANTSTPPALADPADRSVYLGQLVQFQLQASDADGDTISFSSSNLPAGATLSASGAFSWTPTTAQTADISVQATDCTGLSSSQSVQIDASPQPQPHLTALSQTTGWFGDTITLTGTALSGDSVIVRFRSKSATILSLSDTQISLIVPKIKKKYRKRGFQPVTLTRDGVSADNTLSFDYVKPQ
ncbi:MAG TPA: putative Ig domain-containing protein, partial [Myxococcota bacterium]|nr:putative Ig domain-containing protein [Myxococcota bacterium]